MAASTGTLIAAALETAGYKAQSEILAELLNMFYSVGALLYVATFIIAIAVYTLYGNFRLALWMLVGPPIFFFMINSRAMSSGVEWQFGEFKGDKQDVINALPGTINSSVNANVSWFFDAYNRLVSSIMQETLKVITNRDKKKQLMMSTRQKILDKLMSWELNNPGLEALIRFGLQGECRKQMEAMRLVALGNLDDYYKTKAEYASALREFYKEKPKDSNGNGTGSTIKDKTVNIVDNPLAYKFLLELVEDIGVYEAKEVKYRWCSSTELKQMLHNSSGGANLTPAQYVQEPLSCREIWCWSGVAIQREAQILKGKVEDKKVSKYLKEDYRVIDEIWEHIRVKLSFYNPDDRTASYQRKLYEGEENPNDFIVNDPYRGVTEDGDINTGNGSELIPLIIGGIMARKILTQDAKSEKLTGFAKRSRVYASPYGNTLTLNEAQRQDIARRGNQHLQATAIKYESYYYAMTIPYLQGLILYALAILFPFFAMLLIIPGKAQVFFSWMTLWLWVKSWDLGWGVIAVADDIMWNLMPRHSTFDYKGEIEGVNNPISIMELAFQSDPAYSLGNYYLLLSMMIIAVPVVTAHAIIGSKAAVYGTLFKGIQGYAEKLGGSTAQYIGTGQTLDLNERYNKFKKNYAFRKAYVEKEAATPELAAQMQESVDRRNAAKEEKFAAARNTGTTAGSVLIAAGAATGLSALGVITGGVGLIFGGAAVLGGSAIYGNSQRLRYQQANKDLVKENKRIADLNDSNHRAWLWKANMTDEYFALQSMVASASNRQEWWRVGYSSGIEHVPGLIMQTKDASDLTVLGRKSYMGGVYAKSIEEGAQLGVDLYKLRKGGK